MSDELFLTENAYNKLKDELNERKGKIRDAIAKKIKAARDEGDLKENGGYHAARDEQGMNEAKIRDLEYKLSIAQIGVPTDIDKDGKYEITPGMLITAKLSTSDKVLKFVLGARENATDDIDAFSPASPLGGAILGKQEGETASYKAPNGNTINVEILSVSPFV